MRALVVFIQIPTLGERVKAIRNRARERTKAIVYSAYVLGKRAAVREATIAVHAGTNMWLQLEVHSLLMHFSVPLASESSFAVGTTK